MTPDIFLFNFKFYTVMKKEDLFNDDFLTVQNRGSIEQFFKRPSKTWH